MSSGSSPSTRNGSTAYGDADPLGQLGGALDRRLREDHDELLAAVAGERVDLADLLLDPLRELAQDRVAAGVTVLVVDLLEVVEVEHEHRQRAVEPGGPLDLPGQAHRQVAEVPQARERVRGGQPLGLVVQVDVVDRDAGLVGQRAQGVLVGRLEAAAVETVVEGHHRDDVAHAAQRHRKHVALRRLGLGGDQPGRPEPAAHAVAGGEHPAEHARARRDRRQAPAARSRAAGARRPAGAGRPAGAAPRRPWPAA